MVELALPGTHGRDVVADPTPMGLFGLAIGCAALTPVAFGVSLTPNALETAAVFCLAFGAGCQFLAGLLSFVNRNLYGGTLFLTFAFNWILNWWVLHDLARGVVPDPAVLLATEAAFFVIFVLMSWGFGHFGSLLLIFLLDIDLLYAAKLANALLHTRSFDIVIALLTVGLGAIALWIAFALLLNPVTGRQVFALGKPVFRSTARPAVDLALRRGILAVLYGRWRDGGGGAVTTAELEKTARAATPGQLHAEMVFLQASGVIESDGVANSGVRLTAAGIDLWERFLLART